MINLLGKPIITSHQFYAFPLAIISSDSKLYPWIYSEFIQWHTFRDKEDQRMHMRLYNNKDELFLYDPLHGTVIMPKQMASGIDIINTLKGILNDGGYIYDFVDYFYISFMGFEQHYLHDILIHGYNDNLQVIYAYAYHKGKLTEFTIHYSEYIAAYTSDYQKEHVHCTIIYHKKDEVFHPNINRIGNHLQDYLDSINTFNREYPLSVNLIKPKFGLDAYDELKYNLQYMKKWHLSIDIPDMYCVYDHKRLMHERVLYLDEHTDVKCPNALKNKFDEIKKVSRIMIMLVLKLNQLNMSSEIDFNNLMLRFDNMRELEKKAFSEYYEYNRSVFES